MKVSVRFITTAALIAAMYAVITLLLAPISYREIQFRISEVLTVLPFFTPAAIPGLVIGCVLGNMASPLGPIDVILGSTATLLAALVTYKIPKRLKILAPLPPVIANAVIVGFELTYMFQTPLVLNMVYVAVGELAVCYLLGYPFLLLLEKFKNKLFISDVR